MRHTDYQMMKYTNISESRWAHQDRNLDAVDDYLKVLDSPNSRFYICNIDENRRKGNSYEIK